jgi:hypothetical protein
MILEKKVKKQSFEKKQNGAVGAGTERCQKQPFHSCSDENTIVVKQISGYQKQIGTKNQFYP